MPARRRSRAQHRPARAVAEARSFTRRRSDDERDPAKGKRTSIIRWRLDVRPHIIRAAVTAADSLVWSPALFEVLLEELHIDHGIEDVMGRRLEVLQRREYPQAVAVALILPPGERPAGFGPAPHGQGGA